MNRSSFAHEIAPTQVEMACVADSKSIVGESPLWSAVEQCVYFVDIPQRQLHRLSIGNMILESFSAPEIVTAAELTAFAHYTRARGGAERRGESAPSFGPRRRRFIFGGRSDRRRRWPRRLR